MAASSSSSSSSSVSGCLLTINAGGSSVRLAAYSYSRDSKLELIQEFQDKAHVDPAKTITQFLQNVKKNGKSNSSSSNANSSTNTDGENRRSQSTSDGDVIRSVNLIAIVHRIVHGGAKLTEPMVITGQVLKQLTEAEEIDPLHNTPSVHWVEACLDMFHDHSVVNIATFDTFFFTGLPPEARTYAVPTEWTEKYGIHRYGFHGMAHQAMLNSYNSHVKNHPQSVPSSSSKTGSRTGNRLITIQLGSGCSMTAIKDGHPIDTSMGFSALEGLVMTTRVGDIDPAIILYMMQKLNLSSSEMQSILYEKSGMLGLSNGESKDMKVLIESKSEASQLAVRIFVYKIIKYIGSFVSILGGIDAIVFGGGIGEHSSIIRKQIIDRLAEWLDIILDEEKNEKITKQEGKIFTINSEKSPIRILVVKVDEGQIMAEQAIKVLEEQQATQLRSLI